LSVSREGDVVVVDATDYAGCCSMTLTVDLRDGERAFAWIDSGADDFRVRGAGASSALGQVSSGSGAAGLLFVPALDCAVIWLTRGPWRAVAEVGKEEVDQVSRFLGRTPGAERSTMPTRSSPIRG
jgi:hypothetical protein